MKTAKREQGFTLIELMVAATIGLILIAGVMTLLTTSKRTYSFQQQMARMQENARFAFDFIGHGMRMTGYFGCSRSNLYNPNPAAVSMPVIAIPAIIGRDGDASSVNFSDVFMLSYLETDRNAFEVVHCPRDPANPSLRRQMISGSVQNCGDPVTNFTPSPLRQGLGKTGQPIVLGHFGAQRGGLVANPDFLLGAADCRRTDLYRIHSISDTALTLSYPDRSTPANDGLAKDYDNATRNYGAELRQFVSQRFFVALNSAGESALYRDNGIYRNTNCDTLPASVTGLPSINATLAIDNCYAEELIEGVESMQVRWGEDTDGDWVPNIYRTASAVSNWDQIISAEISLLMRTTARFDREADVRDYSAEMDPALAANSLKFDDFRRRVVFKSVIELRNRNIVK
jgi:type IV pilus assembly protein PilW